MPHGCANARTRLNRPMAGLHSLASLLAVVARGERLGARDTSSAGPADCVNVWSLGQRFCSDAPASSRFAAVLREGQAFESLRWGGGGMLLAWWLLGR